MFNIINVTVFIFILFFGGLMFKYKKLETLAVLAALEAEGLSMMSGTKKLEWAVDWLYNQKLFKDTFLSLIPRKITKWVVNLVFKNKKSLIEKERNTKNIRR